MTTDSFHRRNRRLLVDLTSEDVVGEALTRIGRHYGWPADVRWRPEWGRIEDPKTSRIRLMFEAENVVNTLCTLEVGTDGGFVDPVFGRIRATLFPSDDRLATLPTVMHRHVGARIVRYRPGKRCTLRTADAAPRYVKVFADGRGQQLYAEGVELWEASQRGAFGFRIARPLGFDPTARTYSQAEVCGRPIVDDLYDLEGVALARRVGYACGSIPTSGLQLGTKHRPSTELDRTRRRADELLRYIPALRTRVRALLKALEHLHDDLVEAPLRPIHGSPHPNQWLVSDSDLGPADFGLVDFDRLSLGDPELDVATFVAEVDFEAADNRSIINAQFEEGYQDRYGPLDRRRLIVYRAHKHLAKVHRTVKAVRPDGDERAEAHLDTTMDLLAEREWR